MATKTFIRSYNVQGTHFDFDISHSDMTPDNLFAVICNSAAVRIDLPKTINDKFPLLTEFYHALLDPDNAIVGMVLLEENVELGKRVKSRIFFDTTEIRRLVIDNPSDMWIDHVAGTVLDEFKQNEMSSDWHMGYFVEDRPWSELKLLFNVDPE